MQVMNLVFIYPNKSTVSHLLNFAQVPHSIFTTRLRFKIMKALFSYFVLLLKLSDVSKL